MADAEKKVVRIRRIAISEATRQWSASAEISTPSRLNLKHPITQRAGNMSDNPHERAARAEKAIKLVATILSQARESEVDPVAQAAELADHLARATASQWAAIAREAKVRNPSPETRQMVVNILRSLRPKRLRNE